MFCKSVIGLLAAFSVQGMDATQLDTCTVELKGLGDLINQVKELIKTLNEIVSGVLANARETHTGLIDTINTIKEKFLNQSHDAFVNAFTKAIAFLGSKIEEAAGLGIDIAKCITGKHEQLVHIAICLSGKLTKCGSGPVSAAISMVNEDLEIIGEITKNVTNRPAELTKCLATRRPISCVTNMVTSLTQVVLNLPGQIEKMTKEVPTVVDSLKGTLGSCFSKISGIFNSKVDAMIDKVGKCVAELIPEQLFHV